MSNTTSSRKPAREATNESRHKSRKTSNRSDRTAFLLLSYNVTEFDPPTFNLTPVSPHHLRSRHGGTNAAQTHEAFPGGR